ncbi:MAG: ATP-binding cassette domain-containing protein, partial [Pseudonocardiaceae bacterium]
MTVAMIEADGLGRVFGAVTALHEVSFRVPQGSVLGLLGHNGAGKTTLVDILTTRLPPTAGTARVAGFDLADGARIRTRIGLAGQAVAVHERLSGWDNLVVVARL